MIRSWRQHAIWAYPAGTVVRVSHGLYDHVALLGERQVAGERSVLAFSAEAGGFVEQPFSAFAGGRTVTVDGYPGKLPSTIVLWRARAMQGRPYSWSNFNCEHFVRQAHGLPIESPQLHQWAFLGGIFGLLTLAART